MEGNVHKPFQTFSSARSVSNHRFIFVNQSHWGLLRVNVLCPQNRQTNVLQHFREDFYCVVDHFVNIRYYMVKEIVTARISRNTVGFINKIQKLRNALEAISGHNLKNKSEGIDRYELQCYPIWDFWITPVSKELYLYFVSNTKRI